MAVLYNCIRACSKDSLLSRIDLSWLLAERPANELSEDFLRGGEGLHFK
jgi:hypothetical protein